MGLDHGWNHVPYRRHAILRDSFCGGSGCFTGDQIYFYVGRFNKALFQRKLHKQRRKFGDCTFAVKNTLAPLFFFLCSGICMVCGPSFPCRLVLQILSKKICIYQPYQRMGYGPQLPVTPAYIYGEEILSLLAYAKQHWYFALP